LKVHSKEIIESIEEAGIKFTYEFEWKKQLRYYYEFNKNNQVVVQMVDASVNYDYE